MRRVRLSKSLVLATLFCTGGGTAALAGSATTSFQVTATVEAACSVSANDLSFGAYVASEESPVEAATSVTVTCSDGAGYQIGLDQGIGTGATVNDRRMMNGGRSLGYGLYQDAQRTQLWGMAEANAQAGTGTGAAQSYAIYGRIPAGQYSAVGIYSDTITVHVTF
ncbi:Csu type fimbrial protein [Indioceanicola profundi]|uniref:Csu type fimbrial protein n=1 Tax=Indioceanicola profundi TaxID=2220096 RepID=UPI000E6AB2CB|nr:spore coat U domain-containing protein [Indioceanicola profundi]